MNNKKAICLIVFSVYILIVLRLTLFRVGFHNERQANLSLFADLINTYSNVGIGAFFWVFMGNIILFVPFGFFLSVLLKSKNLIVITIYGFLFSLIIEATQYFTRKGVAELDDLILNTLGAAIGFFMYKLLYNKCIDK
jgi:glycopeptide antibiotics resistance protein